MTHVIIPLMVVGVLQDVPAAPVINSCCVCISVENVDVPEPSAHVDRAVSCTSIHALRLIVVSLRSRVGTDTL